MKYILEACDIQKIYSKKESKPLLNSISLSITPGEVVAVMGPSGVGKTTLLHILGSLEKPSKGLLSVCGVVVSEKNAAKIRNQNIGFIFQNFNLLEECSVLENILMPQKIARTNGGSKKAMEILQQMGLESKKHQLTKHLSGGEKQRTAIARALCNDPELILADEPTGNLDCENSKTVQDLLIKAAKVNNKGLIIATHDSDLAKRCDKVYTLEKGKLVEVI